MAHIITSAEKRQTDRTADQEPNVAKKKSKAGRKKSPLDLVALNVNVPRAVKLSIISLAGQAKRTISNEVWLALERHIEAEAIRDPTSRPQDS